MCGTKSGAGALFPQSENTSAPRLSWSLGGVGEPRSRCAAWTWGLDDAPNPRCLLPALKLGPGGPLGPWQGLRLPPRPSAFYLGESGPISQAST